MRCSIAAIWLVIMMATDTSASKMVQLTFGSDWTRAQWYSSKPTSWNAGIESGILIDKKVGFGFEGDFLWNTSSQDSSVGSGKYRTIHADKSFMFPLGGFVMVDPLSDWLIHPTAKLNVGYNSLIHSEADHDTTHVQYYYGLLIKAGADAVYSFGDVGSVFLGAEYQWAQTRSTGENFLRRDMSGVGIHIGFRAAI